MTKTPNLSKLVDEWLVFARESLMSAKALIQADFAPYHIVCFLCQGSAEKYLKAYLISKGWKLRKIHDLADLVGDAMGYDESFAALLPQAWALNDYTEAGRYPSDLAFESITEKQKLKKPLQPPMRLQGSCWENFNYRWRPPCSSSALFSFSSRSRS